MIATHNIKVNGRWYAAGQEVPEQKQDTREAVKAQKAKAEEPVAEVPEVKPVETEQEDKPKTTTTRRKTNK